ncbi:hypothetical protein DPMN_190494 [Dreissena polymorpha]|uniref:Uncharacterized protein n=1 Tax=Dreissena polymorpha TaxID=45954 RepID=A0A9D4DWY7_DREPO|nr:hypothetical protein DPMN_190494 [Dreissena polymorpha]
MVQTIAAIELYHAQREVANYLELAYLNLADHPDVAREVLIINFVHKSETNNNNVFMILWKIAIFLRITVCFIRLRLILIKSSTCL